MKAKVIKDIKGLVPGDILYYQKDTDTYEINKTDYEIGDTSSSTKIVKVVINSYLVDENPEYFTLIDDENNDLEVSKIRWDDFPKNMETIANITETPVPEVKKEEVKESNDLNNLREQVKELTQKLEDIEKVRYPFHVSPFKYSWFI
jgi:hypothetical protein